MTKKGITLSALCLSVVMLACGCGTKNGLENAGAQVQNVQEVVQKEEISAKRNEMAVSLKDKGLEIIGLMDELAADKEYRKAMLTGDSARMKKMLKKAVHKKKPGEIYQVTFQSENSLFQIMEKGGISSSKMTEQEKEVFFQRSIGALAGRFQGGSAEALALSAVYQVEKCFVSDELKEDMVYFYIYKDACPVAVAFLKGEDGAVLAKAQYIFDESFDIYSGQSGFILKMMSGKIKKL